ncbi:hypothetical protein K432DRAFT_380584 [Lepidopterella palustris CBS 459.81]|uniref:COX assembly mitochondrial protein n=1 Tax=Lepidopterella palustris CBS 459.81 TaxID=1314670 RepID=A0A8E2JH47_9PEZI|nr:hypothetical protein K432DRAFT_380584 [Lepidopterella palustris CBS 459.81]
MATMNSSPPQTGTSIETPAAPKPPPVFRNPVPLSAGQEQQVRELYYKRVRTKCADEIRDFASCALNRTISATWACRQQRLAMNACMVHHATPAEQDAAREAWFTGMEERRKEREEKERKRVEQEKFHREWWGLDENGVRKGNGKAPGSPT